MAAVIVLTLAGSALAGLVVGAELDRAVSTGLYVVGCFFLVLGFFSGVRGPVRPRGGDDEEGASGPLFGLGVAGRGARTATKDERADARATTWLFMTLGLTLIVAGIVTDSRVGLI